MRMKLFVYGSLMSPEVINRVILREPRSIHGILQDHHRFQVKGVSYPAVIPQTGSSVHGMIYEDLSDAEISLLDTFEGLEYSRALVDIKVQLVDSPAVSSLQCYTYLWAANKDLLFGTWDYDINFKPHESQFLEEFLPKAAL